MAGKRKMENVFNPPKSNTQFSEGHKSKGILDDHAVRQNVASKEGTIEHVPTLDNHIVNKEYVDGQFPVTHTSTTGRTADDHHAETHTILSHDTLTTGAELTSLADNSIVNDLHRHSELVASDGSPDPALIVIANGRIGMGTETPENQLHLSTAANNAFQMEYLGAAGEATLLRLSRNEYSANDEDWIAQRSADGTHIFSSIEFRIVDPAEDIETGQIRFSTSNNGSLTEKIVINEAGNLGIGTMTPTAKLSVKEKSGMSAIGGICIKLTNKTGGNTVAGQLIAPYSATAVNDAFKTALANSDEVFGIVLDAGVSDGNEAWVVISGIANVLMDAGGSARGDRIISSATAGSADVWNVGGAVATHFQEIGHCMQTRTGAGLARCILHFN